MVIIIHILIGIAVVGLLGEIEQIFIPLYLAFIAHSFFVLIILKVFKDIKNPFSIYSIMYLTFMVLGLLPFAFIVYVNMIIFKMIALGFYFYTAGYAIARKHIKYPINNKINTNHLDLPNIFFWVIFFVGLISLVVFYKLAGAIPMLNKEMAENRALVAQGKGYYIQLFKFCVVPLYLILAIRLQRKSQLFDIKFLIMTSIVFLGLLSTGYRSYSLEVVLTMLLIYYFSLNKQFRLRTAIAVAFPMFIFIVAVGYYRISADDKLTALLTETGLPFYVNLINMDYILDKFPKTIPFQYGSTYLMNFLMLRPGPDLDFTMWLREQLALMHFSGGATPSIIGEWYLNFGNIGMIGMFLIGVMICFVERCLYGAKNVYTLVIFITITLYLTKSIRGGISSVLLEAIINIGLIKAIEYTSWFKIFGRQYEYQKNN